MMLAFSGKMLVIGLTKRNVEQLRELKPASITGPHPMQVQEVLVVYGDDKPHIIRQLEAVGVEFSQAMKDTAAEDPE